MKIPLYFVKYFIGLMLLPWLFACKQELPIEYPHVNISYPPQIGSPFVAGTYFSLAEFGYEEEEFFFRGEAKSYRNTSALSSDGQWEVEPVETAIYKTRMLVRRPIAAENFNGTVVVEWLNVTGGVDTATDWIMLHNEMMRSGFAWVGISVQRIGIEGGVTPLPTPIGTAIPLKLVNLLRYFSLSHPGDSFSYDIFSQAARAIRSPPGIAPLGSLTVEKLIAVGESQSATRLVTYYNAFEGNQDLFDGYLIHSRLGLIPDFGGASAPISQTPQESITTNDVVRMRDDLNKPILNLQTETDLFKLGAYHSRQEDSETFRLWEVAGTAHADFYIITQGALDKGSVDSAKLFVTKSPNVFLSPCEENINSAPQHHFVGNIALRSLNEWIVKGIAPPSAPRLMVNAAGTAVVRDVYGNAMGGVRSPYMDVPIAILSGENVSVQNESDICFLFGKTQWLDSDTLNSLYPDKATYVTAVSDSAQQLVESGYLLPEDAAIIIDAAKESPVFSE